MPTTSPLLGVPLPEATDADNVPGDLGAAVNTLETYAVFRFSDTATRDGVLTSPVAGMVSYLADLARLETFNGTGWYAGPGFVAESLVTANTLSTGTEVFANTITFTSPSVNDRYKLTWAGSWFSTVVSDILYLRLRYQAGAAVTSAGTQMRINTARVLSANNGLPGTLVATVTGITGQHTVGVSAQRSSGTGSAGIAGSANDHSYLLLERI